MSLVEATTFPVTGAVFGDDSLQTIFGDGLSSLQTALDTPHKPAAAFERSFSVLDRTPARQRVTIQPKKPETFSTSQIQTSSFEEKVFSSLVSLKVSVSKYAMHLSHHERHRVFQQLDSVINTDDWHEEDELPQIGAFEDFLKWMIYSKYFKWLSIGVSDEGTLLVAWRTKRVLLTANFSGKEGVDSVRWTAQIHSAKGEIGHTVGKCPLRLFSTQAMFYLQEAEANEANEHR
jgi:hypothetical protein